jgi:hypothetical protein
MVLNKYIMQSKKKCWSIYSSSNNPDDLIQAYQWNHWLSS